ncbi:alpha/beta fold hydrolase [Amycolatopsis sp. CA-161197]|uniref:alpha/beta fold hydrolase n=1 Tax=Amycolatopsis sp. CA-161197 TaxID=3239922 RepID=UPI003D8F3207
MKPNRTATLALAAVSLGALTVAPAAAATPPLSWGTCPAPTPDASSNTVQRDPRQQCATLTVPLDYAHPHGKTITLTISRIPGTKHQPLAIGPGGPGGSGLDQPSVWSTTAVGKQLLSQYDLIGFDDRGIGNSTPVLCGLSDADRAATLADPYPAPDGDISANVTYARRVAATCAKNAGAYLPYLNTKNVAQDMDRIRQALGARELNYYGTSYGTYRGAVYASMFPRNTGKIVLDSSTPPGGVTAAIRLKGEAVETAFPPFAEWAADHDSTFHLGTTPDAIEAAYFRITAALDTHPRTFDSGRVLTGNDVRVALPPFLEKPATYPVIATLMALGDGQDLPFGTTFTQPIPDNFASDQYAVLCGDAPVSRDPATYAAAVQQDRQVHPLTNGMPVDIWPCAFWPRDAVHQPQPITANGPRNVLMLQNHADPSTASSGALEMRQALGRRAELTTIDDAGHGVDLTNVCTAGRLTDFLLEDHLPGRDTTCP